MKTAYLLTCIALSLPSLSAAKVINVDGDPSDWTGTPSATVHEAVISDEEWIYTGAAGDLRTDAVGNLGNYDLTEARLTFDPVGGNMYLLVRFADITDISEVSVAIGIDNDQDAGDANGLTFLGDDSGVTFAGGAQTHPEYVVHFHNAQPGITWAEYFHDAGSGFWYSNPGDADVFISAANDVLEARISLASIELNPSEPFGFSLVTFDNGTTGDPGAVAFNNDDDTTVDYPGHDALDGVGGTPGVTENAYNRIFGGSGDPGPYDPPTIPNFPEVPTPTVTSVSDWELLGGWEFY